MKNSGAKGLRRPLIADDELVTWLSLPLLYSFLNCVNNCLQSCAWDKMLLDPHNNYLRQRVTWDSVKIIRQVSRQVNVGTKVKLTYFLREKSLNYTDTIFSTISRKIRYKYKDFKNMYLTFLTIFMYFLTSF